MIEIPILKIIIYFAAWYILFKTIFHVYGTFFSGCIHYTMKGGAAYDRTMTFSIIATILTYVFILLICHGHIEFSWT